MFGFKDIPGFEGMYSVSDQGNVYSYANQNFIKPIFSEGQGYFVILKTNIPPIGRPVNERGIYRYKLAKLVYETFKGRLSGRDMVFHLNDDLLDNSIENLGVKPRYSKEVNAHIEKVASEDRLEIIDEMCEAVCYIYGIDKSYIKSKTRKAIRVDAVKCAMWLWNQYVSKNIDKYPTVNDLTSTLCTYFNCSRATATIHLNTAASLYKTYKTHRLLYDLAAKMFFYGYDLTQEDIDMANTELDKRLISSKMGVELITGEIVKKRSNERPQSEFEALMDSIYRSTPESRRKEIMSLFSDGYMASYIDLKFNYKSGFSRYVIERDFVPEEKDDAEGKKSAKRKMIAKREKYLTTSNSQKPGTVVNRGKPSLSQY